MKKNIHPNYKKISVICSCGDKMEIFSTINKKHIHLDICGSCHPFFTGKQRIVDTSGRIERFNKRFKNF
ncbi:50S ribosomal protein L31 [Buchnera aphidicola (Ceratoglyphina bambusae)]|uniref:50S ribosomal protein L31 n=1 Tax=Buchnera aphidicola TaxID=9 RepID=UPI0031B87B43